MRGSVGISDSAGQTRHKVPDIVVPVWCLRVPSWFLLCLLGHFLLLHIDIISLQLVAISYRIPIACVYNVYLRNLIRIILPVQQDAVALLDSSNSESLCHSESGLSARCVMVSSLM